MTDGPFRNAELTSRWKQYGSDLVSDATSLEERIAQASHSMLGDVDVKEFSLCLSDLAAHVQQPQMDLDPISSIEAIFDTHPRSSQMDILQKHLIADLREQMDPKAALDRALRSTAADWIDTAKNRIDEECIRSRYLGDMNRDSYPKALERNSDTFAAVSPDAFCDALISGNKRAFKQALQKKSGVDEGPGE